MLLQIEPFAFADDEPIDLTTLRETLKNRHGRDYWRSLEELGETPAFRRFLEQEFPASADNSQGGFNRRDFLKLMGASFALAGLAACDPQRAEKIVPAVKPVEELVPGKPIYYATTLMLGGYGTGVLVESHTGRPTKIEGNPLHPASLGSTDARTQAEILNLYDPDRSQLILSRGNRIRTWADFTGALRTALAGQEAKGGAGLRILTEPVTSPTLAAEIGRLLEAYPNARWFQYAPVGDDARRRGAEIVFGEPLHTIYRFDRADVILALDADFLSEGPGAVRYARDFATRRKAQQASPEMNRLYAVECIPTLTGAAADHRLAIRSSEVELFARAIARELRLPGAEAASGSADERWVKAVAEDLKAHRGQAIVLAGMHQPPEVHAITHLLNEFLGNVGETVLYTEPIEASPISYMEEIGALADEMAAGAVEMLVVLGGNPVYTAPAEIEFGSKLANVPFSVHLGLHADETAQVCMWHIPEAHELETWGDARAFDGTVSIVQPLIKPLYGGKSPLELTQALLGAAMRTPYDVVQSHWQEERGGADFDAWWRRSLHDGLLEGTAAKPKAVTVRADARALFARPIEVGRDLEIDFRPDPTIWDGRFANNGWLQEAPKPITRLTWDNAALLAPKTAERLGVRSGDLCELQFGGRTLTAAVWVLPGHAPGAVTLHLGYGRTAAGNVGTGTGFNAYTLRTTTASGFGLGLSLRKTGKRYKLVSTQDHQSMEGRDIVRVGTLDAFREDPESFSHGEGHEAGSFYPPQPEAPYAWGMVIDLSACIGCGACTVACQSENNIAVVGKKQVSLGREMHWIRVDRYFIGDIDAPETVHQPIPCMQCENAPCEPVCPVLATTHSAEGLNEMVYNRCVGTRYCANNCPYKVRRFNFLQYADKKTEVLKLGRNPDVTVRTRGVMEKCTYCVQRINHARIEAKKAGRPIQEGDIVTACQQVCPTGAITFGNIADPKSRVAQLREEPHHYSLLPELNLTPRTTYLARVRNPNPALEPTSKRSESHA